MKTETSLAHYNKLMQL